MILSTASISRKGSRTSANQDALLEDARRGLFAVADGIGGFNYGETASSMAIECLERTFADLSKFPQDGAIDLRLHEAFEVANRAILRAGTNIGRKMGTTLTAAILTDTTCYVAHSGDSRAYLFADRTIQQLTNDNRLVADMVHNGIITESDAESNPHRNILTGCLGLQQPCRIQLGSYPWTKNRKLILCTDGVTDWVSRQEIAQQLLLNESSSSIVESLVSLALSNGSTDDVSVVAVSA